RPTTTLPPADPFSGHAYAASSLAELANEEWDEGSSRAKDAFRTEMLDMPVQAQAAPARELKKEAEKGVRLSRVAAPAPGAMPLGGAVPMGEQDATRARGGGGAFDQKPREPVVRLDYGNLRMASP